MGTIAMSVVVVAIGATLEVVTVAEVAIEVAERATEMATTKPTTTQKTRSYTIITKISRMW